MKELYFSNYKIAMPMLNDCFSVAKEFIPHFKNYMKNPQSMLKDDLKHLNHFTQELDSVIEFFAQILLHYYHKESKWKTNHFVNNSSKWKTRQYYQALEFAKQQFEKINEYIQYTHKIVPTIQFCKDKQTNKKYLIMDMDAQDATEIIGYDLRDELNADIEFYHDDLISKITNKLVPTAKSNNTKKKDQNLITHLQEFVEDTDFDSDLDSDESLNLPMVFSDDPSVEETEEQIFIEEQQKGFEFYEEAFNEQVEY